ncbi:hypothetical protein FB567DRAFT_100155 [Paraphoma chrysanthemicola]|uniref:Uncharacterized protein n=1 Tax=Paraphoma chrysanthemicola TaxID=798071 RepID=A0A8K0R0P4_9PLEO|nr:hypothetical protein FB567DRAFT_100155 [Paraphoma chrysanthemicola]
MATQHSLPKTPSRRALGDLTPQSINSPTTQPRNVDASEAIRPRSPLKKVTSHIPSVFADKENLLAPDALPPSKKRGIDEVDDVERPGYAKMLARGRDESLWDSGMRLTTAAMQQYTENNPVGLADPGSPTERNTPTPEPEPIQDSQKSNQSFSDLLNYELCASQKSDHAPVEPAPTSVPTSAPAEDRRKSRAELLRTRLKFGLYKVKTNQASKSARDIISTFEASASSDALASSSTTMTSSAESLSTPRVPDITISSPRREPVFVKANLDPFRPIGKLGQPPVQFGIPKDGTQVSSRMIQPYDLSSSPPGPVLPQSISPEQLMSPVKQQLRLGEHDDADIEEGAAAAHRRLQCLKDQSYYASDPTSNAVKGNAAVGLLELMHSRR